MSDEVLNWAVPLFILAGIAGLGWCVAWALSVMTKRDWY